MMKRLAALSLLVIVLLAGFTPGHAAAQPPAPSADVAPAPERPYFASLGSEPPTPITRYGQSWKQIVAYGKYRDPMGLRLDVTIELDSDEVDIDTTTQANVDGGFYVALQVPVDQTGIVWIRGLAPDGRQTQLGEIYIPPLRS